MLGVCCCCCCRWARVPAAAAVTASSHLRPDEVPVPERWQGRWPLQSGQNQYSVSCLLSALWLSALAHTQLRKETQPCKRVTKCVT